eukprot:jgi/Undpi1/11077/HiC_scaffold_30.g13375.m1
MTHCVAEQVGYDPKRSKVSDDKLAEFIRSAISGDITEVPGIANRGKEILAEGEGDDCVTNTHQLIGKFLSLRGPDKDGHEVDSVEHCDKFWYWLQAKGINSNRSGIVNAIAEKVNTWIPGGPATGEDDAYVALRKWGEKGEREGRAVHCQGGGGVTVVFRCEE